MNLGFKSFGTNAANSVGFVSTNVLLILGCLLLVFLAAYTYIDPIDRARTSRDVIRLETLDVANRAIHAGLVNRDFYFEGVFGCEGCKTPADILADLPVDPLNRPPFVYKFTSSPMQGYKLAARLESRDLREMMHDDSGIYPYLYEVGTDLSLEF